MDVLIKDIKIHLLRHIQSLLLYPLSQLLQHVEFSHSLHPCNEHSMRGGGVRDGE